MLMARLTRWKHVDPNIDSGRPSGRSSVVEHDLAKVGVEGSNPFARSSFFQNICIDFRDYARLVIVLLTRRRTSVGRPL